MRFVPMRSRRAKAIAVAAATVAVGTTAVALASPASAATSCQVTYSVVNSWQGGFQGSIVINNTGDAWTSWSLTFSFANGQSIQQGWNGRATQSGSNVTFANESWNGSVGTGGSVNPGFLASWNGTNNAPTSFAVNGVACNGSTPTSSVVTSRPPTSSVVTSRPPTSSVVTSRPPTSSVVTSRPPTSSVVTSRPPTSSVVTSRPPTSAVVTGGGPKVDNPYAGVPGYVNPEWKAKAESVAGGNRVSNNPTAVWLDRIAAIEGTENSQSNGPMGLRDHLDEALAQGAGYIQVVIYNLPGRDCSALASNGELGVDELPRYKAEYIDPIAAIQGDPKYRNLRIINIVEIDSLPNLLTNTNLEKCATMKANGGYVNGIAYALQKLGAIPNVYNYVDAAHHGWIGWDTNFGPTADLMYQTAVASGSVNNVTGFITNTSNYSALTEPFFTINTTVNGQSVRQAKYIDWNFYVDELTFAQAFRNRLVQSGFNSNIGMLIDTSRNGWGDCTPTSAAPCATGGLGAQRPTAASTSTDVNTFVNQSRIDRRLHAGNWCNQAGAGIGERPKAAPASGIDAYVWVKPPGESDGSSTAIPNNDGKGFDRMCDPTYGGNDRNGNNATGALPGAPIAGAFFTTQFSQLMANAYPPLS